MFTFDPVDGIFRGIVKNFLEIRGYRRRSVFATESSDLFSWTFPRPALIPDVEDDAWAEAYNTSGKKMAHTQVYGMPIFRYECMLIGFPQMFRVTDTASHDGAVDLQLTSSRDGLTWNRAGNRETLVPVGEPGSYDAGGVYGGNSLMVDGDEVRLYYTGCSTTHALPGDTGVCMVSWRRDRFVGLAADPSGGYVELKRRKAGKTLHLNADASRGAINLTISNTEIGERLVGDKLDHAVTMPQHLIGKEVAVRLELKDAEVFSLWWD